MSSLSNSTPWSRRGTSDRDPSWLARLSEASRAHLALARDEALRLWGVAAPEPDHLLLALLAGGEPALLGRLPPGADPARLRSRVEAAVLRERPRVFYLRDVVPVELAGELSVMPRLREVLERAAAEAPGGDEIQPRHLVVGLLAGAGGTPAALLREPEAPDARETPRPGGFALAVDDGSGLPVYEQLVRQVEEAVATGSLRRGERLPAVRALADRLEVAPGTVARAYAELEHRGVVATAGPKGTRVAERPPPSASGAELAALLRPAVVAAYHRGAGPDELRAALESAMRGIFPAADPP